MIKFFNFVNVILAVCVKGTLSYAHENWEAFSLMYTNDECQYVRQGRQSGPVTKSPAAVSTIQLQGVAYVSPEKWTVWINNDCIDPDHPHPDLDIVNASPTKVSLAFKHKSPSAVVELHINQSLDLSTIHYVEQENLKTNDKIG